MSAFLATDLLVAPFVKVSSLLVAELQPLSSLLAEQCARLQSIDEPYHYVYFNRANLAIKATPASRSPPDAVGKLSLAHAVKVGQH